MASYPHPQARPRKPKRVSTVVRDSNLVRASVLDAALELGVAHNSTMANWIFNSPVEEEAEEPEPEVEEVRSTSQFSMLRLPTRVFGADRNP